MTGRIKYSGWLSPDGKLYPVTDTTHAEWILDHYDWLVSKGAKLPSTIEIRDKIKAKMGEDIRNLLARQGWIAIHTPTHWIVGSLSSSGKAIEDAILSGTVSLRPSDYPIEILDLSRGQQTKIDEDELKDRGIVASMKPFNTEKTRRTSDFLIHCTHSFKINGDSKRDFVNFDMYDLLADADLSTKLKLALVENGMHSDSPGYYNKELTDHDKDSQYNYVVNQVFKSFKEMIKDPLVAVSLESPNSRTDRHNIYILKATYE